jgi:hypothetical protein
MVKQVGISIIFLLEMIIEKLAVLQCSFANAKKRILPLNFVGKATGYTLYTGLSMLDCEVRSYYFKSKYYKHPHFNNQLKSLFYL